MSHYWRRGKRLRSQRRSEYCLDIIQGQNIQDFGQIQSTCDLPIIINLVEERRNLKNIEKIQSNRSTAVKLVKERRSLQNFVQVQLTAVTSRRNTVNKNLSNTQDLVEELRRLENSEVEPVRRRDTSSKEETRTKVGRKLLIAEK